MAADRLISRSLHYCKAPGRTRSVTPDCHWKCRLAIERCFSRSWVANFTHFVRFVRHWFVSWLLVSFTQPTTLPPPTLSFEHTVCIVARLLFTEATITNDTPSNCVTTITNNCGFSATAPLGRHLVSPPACTDHTCAITHLSNTKNSWPTATIGRGHTSPFSTLLSAPISSFFAFPVAPLSPRLPRLPPSHGSRNRLSLPPDVPTIRQFCSTIAFPLPTPSVQIVVTTDSIVISLTRVYGLASVSLSLLFDLRILLWLVNVSINFLSIVSNHHFIGLFLLNLQ